MPTASESGTLTILVPRSATMRPKLRCERQAGRVNAQPRAEHPIVRVGVSAALQMAERNDARFDSRPLFDQIRDDLANSAQPDVTELVDFRGPRDEFGFVREAWPLR